VRTVSQNVRLLCSIVMATIPAAVHAQQPGAPLSAFATAKAERLLREKASCLGCHQLKGEGGVLGPALDDVRTRRDAAYIATMVSDPQHTKPGASMPRLRMPASELQLLVRYLGGDVTRIVTAPAPPASGGVDGKALYAQWCAGCHGATGNGDGPNAARLPVAPAKHRDAKAMSARSDDVLFDTIEAGGAIMNKSHRMPAFGGSLTSLQIRALVQYIRTLCNCQPPAWSRDGQQP
jgi:cytochrome c oxidase cbb3-type subunit III